MNLVKLRRHEHPAPPHHELRGRRILDSHNRGLGDVEHIFVDQEGHAARFIQAGLGGFMGMGEKHYLIPVEAIDDETPGAIHLSVSEEDIKGSPAFDPHQEVDDELQRAVYEHYGYPAPQTQDQQE